MSGVYRFFSLAGILVSGFFGGAAGSGFGAAFGCLFGFGGVDGGSHFVKVGGGLVIALLSIGDGGADFGDYLVGDFGAATVEDGGESFKFVFHNL